MFDSLTLRAQWLAMIARFFPEPRRPSPYIVCKGISLEPGALNYGDLRGVWHLKPRKVLPPLRVEMLVWSGALRHV